MTVRFRIMPAMFSRFKLERWFGLPFLGFWEMDTVSDDYGELAERVRLCGGVLVNRPTPSKEK